MWRRRRPNVLVGLAAAVTLGLGAIIYSSVFVGEAVEIELDLSEPCLNPAPIIVDGDLWWSGQSGPPSWDNAKSVEGMLRIRTGRTALFTAADGTVLEFEKSSNGFDPMHCSVRN